MASESWFECINMAPPVENFKVAASFLEDTHPNKVNLGVGAYRTGEGKPWVLPIVKRVQAKMAADKNVNHEYLPGAGIPDYKVAATKLLLGDDNPVLADKRADSIQAVGGTGAIRIGLDFLRSRLGTDTVYASNPTWVNHKGIARSLGYPNVREYRYWDGQNKTLDFTGMMEDLKNAPARSVILLHAAAHNPTGCDPTKEQWAQIANVCRERNLFPFLDAAYQGFTSGDLDKDAWSVRYFIEQGFELFIAQSFSKNFGLYNERVGNLIFVSRRSDQLARISSHLMTISRQTVSTCPASGARVVAAILNDPALRAEWEGDVKTMAKRIQLMRQELSAKLHKLGTPGTWDHIVKQSGMFSFPGLSTRQVDYLTSEYHIYMLRMGRVNMCGVNPGNIDYVAKAIDYVVRNIKDEAA